MNVSLQLDGSRARVRVDGYLSVQAGENLARLLQDLGRMDTCEIILDISECSPVCVGALEILLEVKFRLADSGVKVGFRQPPPTVAKVFRIMGLGADGELQAQVRST